MDHVQNFFKFIFCLSSSY